MPGRDDHGFVDISATALNAAINGSILVDPETCFAMMIAFVSEDRFAPSSSPGSNLL
jgi:hypothetical protein